MKLKRDESSFRYLVSGEEQEITEEQLDIPNQ
jgi:hypothetical protein